MKYIVNITPSRTQKNRYIGSYDEAWEELGKEVAKIIDENAYVKLEISKVQK